MVNGFFTELFSLSSGVRQGCPLSPFLFIIVIEVLNRAISSDPLASGIKISVLIELRILLFADDIALIASSWQSHLCQLEILDLYERATAAKVNPKKSSLLSFRGIPRGATSNFSPASRSGERYLGAWYNLNGLVPQLPRIRTEIFALLQQWSSPSMTPLGRVTILNSYVFPKIFYLSTVEHQGSSFWTSFSAPIRSFIWNVPPHRAFSTMTPLRMFQPKVLGGLGLFDLQLKITTQRLHLFFKMLHSSEWWAQSWREQLGISDIYSQNFDIDSVATYPLINQVITSGSNKLLISCLKAIVDFGHLFDFSKVPSFDSIYSSISSKPIILTPSQLLRSSPPLNWNFHVIFRRLWSVHLKKSIQVFTWKLFNHALPRTPNGKSPCSFCQQPETTFHLFETCTEAQAAWARASSLWSLWTGRTFETSSRSLWHLGPLRKKVKVNHVLIIF